VVLWAGMRKNRGMPTPARPANNEGAQEPIAHLGNLVKAAIIAYLRAHPESGAKAIIDALGLPKATVAPYLGELEGAGLVLAKPPRESRERGEWVVYWVNDSAVSELVLRLAQELGEI
jgi:ArsR family transcriptional regulator